MRQFSYENIADMVHSRIESEHEPSDVEVKTVTIRLYETEVSELDLLTEYLGFASRQQTMAQLMATSIEHALLSVSEALSDNPQLHQQFTEERLRILEDAAREV